MDVFCSETIIVHEIPNLTIDDNRKVVSEFLVPTIQSFVSMYPSSCIAANNWTDAEAS